MGARAMVARSRSVRLEQLVLAESERPAAVQLFTSGPLGSRLRRNGRRMTVAIENKDDLALAEKLRAGLGHVRQELARRIVGQEEALDQVLLTLLGGATASSPACPVWPRH